MGKKNSRKKSSKKEGPWLNDKDVSWEKLSQKKEKLFKKVDNTLAVSGSSIITMKQEMESLQKRANENMKSWSILL